MKIINYSKLNKTEKEKLLLRPAINNKEVQKIVKPILNDIKTNGLESVKKYAQKYDRLKGNNIKVDQNLIANSEKKVPKEFKDAVKHAIENIHKFHKEQLPKSYTLETMKGVKCSRVFRPIENVGLYIPGGTASLPSTLMMLAIPAKIAGCKRIVVTSPFGENINNELLYVTKVLGITEFYKIGGTQAIGLLAYGIEKIKKVDKIFGPGNQFVTVAKSIVSTDIKGASIDMLAGPSELLVIADESANPKYVAADLLSQAEHGNDSQVILCTTNNKIADSVIKEIDEQKQKLERIDYVNNSLKNSFTIIFKNIESAVQFSNQYAPEHLILNIKNSKKVLKEITNAGSVFVGNYSPESVGDYASGTNHSLPTYGLAKSIGGVSVEQFMKGITVQELTKNGLKDIAQTVITLAEAEQLQAHSNAVKIRENK